MNSTYNVGDRMVSISWGRYGDALRQFRSFLETVMPFQVHQISDLDNVPIHLEHELEAASKYRTYRWKSHFTLYQGTQRRLAESDESFRADDGKARPFAVAVDFSHKIDDALRRLSQVRSDFHQISLKLDFQNLLETVLYAIMNSGNGPGLAWSLYQVLLRGYIPICWRGPWPSGVCLAYCPPGMPHSSVPIECIPTPERMAAGGLGPHAVKPRLPSYMGMDHNDISAMPASTWQDAVADVDQARAFRNHFAGIADSFDGRALLDLMSPLVTKVRITEGRLRFELADSPQGESMHIVCEPPIAGPYRDMPRSLAKILARHNGMTLMVDGEASVSWLLFKDGRFDLDWTNWWRPDPTDPEELFVLPPLVPVFDCYDIWLMHPLLLTGDGEAAVVYMSHGRNTLSAPLPCSIGEVWIRLLRDRVMFGRDGIEAPVDGLIRGG